MQAVRQLQQVRPAASAGDQGSPLAAGTPVSQADLDALGLDVLDSVELSADAQAAADTEALGPTEGDDALGAIVERFVRQRSVMQIGLPIQTASGAGVFSLSVELDEAYRVIEFVPRGQRVDQLA